MICLDEVAVGAPDVHPRSHTAAPIPIHRAAMYFSAVVTERLNNLSIAHVLVSEVSGMHHIENP